MKRVLWVLLVLAVIGGSVYAYRTYRGAPPEPTVTTAPVARGEIVDRVGATGTLQAVTTVQVGTQVSGTIQELHADFNSLVRKGQVLARLDPSLFETQIEQARANLIRAQAEVERLRVALEDTRTKLTRARELSDRQLIPRSELETAEVAVRSTEAQLRSSEAQVVQAQAALNQNVVNLRHTVIEAPIDGLVISRNVDVGQTVAASMQAPTLFVLAADLTKMQVIANLDESDVGRIRPSQRVTFRVDAFPTEEFEGRVVQVRLQPIVQQNVVTYATVIDVPNPDLKLKPGMTANVNVEIARRANVLRVPNTALRFRPTSDIYAALQQTPPPAGGRGAMNGEGFTSSEATSPAAPPAGHSAPSGRGAGSPRTQPGGRSGTESSEESRNRDARRERLRERLQGLPPEERERILERMRARGVDPLPQADAPGSDPQTQGARPHAVPPSPSREGADLALSRRHPGATTIDALFGPLPAVETAGRVWLFVDKQLKPVRVRLGISDGQATELLEGEITEGTELVTNVTTDREVRPAPTGALPPFMGQPGRYPGGPGGFGGFGGGRGGGR